MEKNEIINTIKGFISGSMSIGQFKKICKSDQSFRNEIKRFKDNGEKTTYIFVNPNTKQEYKFEEMY